MSRPPSCRRPAHVLCSLLVLGLSLPFAHAATAPEVRALAALGGLLTVDDQFSAADVGTIVSAAPGRVTVMCKGFRPSDARTFLNGGAIVFVDSTFPGPEIVALCQQGKSKVIVDPAGVATDVIQKAAAAGAFIKPGEGGDTYAEKQRTLAAGGQVVVDKRYPAGQVEQLVAAGRVRVHVMSRGFKPGEVELFVRGGAIVWVDRTMPAADARRLATVAGQRLVVRAGGFSMDDLRALGLARAQLVFTRDPRESHRAARFQQLHEDSDPSSRSWRGGLTPN